MEHIPEGLIAFFLALILEFSTEGPIWFSTRETSLKYETIDIESRSSAEDRDLIIFMKSVYDRFCVFSELDNRKKRIWTTDIEEMMWDMFHLMRHDLSGSDIHLLVDLSSIYGEDLALEHMRNIEGESGFP